MIKEPATWVWVTLCAATLLSWTLGNHHGSSAAWISCVLLGVAGIKIRCVLVYFMELGSAPRAWRRFFDGILLTLTASLIALYLR